jgi:cobalt/nickel transport system permease protein
MAFYGCFIGALLIWKPMMKKGMSRTKIIIASIVGCVLTLQLGAFSVTLETLASGITELPFTTFVAAMQPIHLAIGLVEGLITAAVLVFVYEARPELLYCSTEEERNAGKFSFKNTMAILAVVVVVIGGLLSQVASSNPDGLEWSIERLTGSTELESTASGIYQTAESIQEVTSLFPDYAFKGSESALGTTFSGIMGSLVVVVICIGACYLFKFFRKNKQA